MKENDFTIEFLQAIKSIDNISQYSEYADQDRQELHIGKNDPKDGRPDYWFIYYGNIEISRCWSFSELIIKFSKALKELKTQKDDCISRLGLPMKILNILLVEDIITITQVKEYLLRNKEGNGIKGIGYYGVEMIQECINNLKNNEQ